VHKTAEEKTPQRESTKDKIIEIAAEIIAQEGLRGFTAKNIAARLNITDAAIFKHFKTMDDIVQAVVRKYTNECLVSIRTIIFGSNLSVREKIDKIMDTHIDMLEKSKGAIPILCFEVSRSNIYDNKAVLNFLENYLDLVSILLHRGIEEGIIRKDIDIEEAAFTFLGLLQSRVFIWFLKGEGGNIVKDKKTIKLLFEEGLFGASP